MRTIGHLYDQCQAKVYKVCVLTRLKAKIILRTQRKNFEYKWQLQTSGLNKPELFPILNQSQNWNTPTSGSQLIGKELLQKNKCFSFEAEKYSFSFSLLKELLGALVSLEKKKYYEHYCACPSSLVLEHCLFERKKTINKLLLDI